MPTTTTKPRYAPADPRLIDAKIAHPLGKLRGIIRRYVAIEGVLAVALFLATWFWAAMLIDYGVFEIQSRASDPRCRALLRVAERLQRLLTRLETCTTISSAS